MDDRIDEAMTTVKRRWFLPRAQRPFAGADRPLPIGHDATNSQPRTVANMLRLLDPQPGCRALDVGSGSGWTTALLARLVGSSGEVVGVELEPELVEWGRANVTRRAPSNARIEQALDGVFGWPADAPYDRILVSASARELHQGLVDQLAAGGVMVIVVRGRMLRVSKRAGGEIDTSDHGAYSFVPLR